MRPLLLVSNVAGKIAAVLLWHRSPWGAVACFVAPDLALLYGMLVPPSQMLCPVVTAFRPAAGRREIWLTIDDGPDPADTPRLLDLLERHGAKATFFLIGRRARQYPDLAREIVRRGHQLGNHTATHPHATFWVAGSRRVARELDEAAAALSEAGGRTDAFRPPVGIKNLFLRSALARRGMTCIGWTIRSGDCFTAEPSRPVRRVLRRLRPGAIVLAHEGPSVPPAVRVEFLRRLLDELSARDYACVIPAPARWQPAAASAGPAGGAGGERPMKPG